MSKLPSFALIFLVLVFLCGTFAYPSQPLTSVPVKSIIRRVVSASSLANLKNEYDAKLLSFNKIKFQLQLVQARYALLKLRQKEQGKAVNKDVNLCQPEPCRSGFHCLQTDGQSYKCIKNLARRLSDPEKKDVIKVQFDQADTSGDGVISLMELGKMFKSLGIKFTLTDVKKIIHKFDADGSRSIDLNEFRKLMKDVLAANGSYKEAYEAFKNFDRNGDDRITLEEVKAAIDGLAKKMTNAEVLELWERMDKNGNKYVDFDEFAKAYAFGL